MVAAARELNDSIFRIKRTLSEAPTLPSIPPDDSEEREKAFVNALLVVTQRQAQMVNVLELAAQVQQDLHEAVLKRIDERFAELAKLVSQLAPGYR